MKLSPADEYETFWDKLLPTYTISKGSMRLPIATSLTNLPNFSHTELIKELQKILQSLLDTHATKEAAVKRALSAEEHRLIPLLTDEYTGVVRFDCIWNPESGDVKILEINCDYPDGLILHDATYGALDKSTCTLHQDRFADLFSPEEDVHVLHSAEAFFLDGYYAEYRNLSSSKRLTSIGSSISNVGQRTTIRRCLEVTKLSTEDIDQLISLSPRLINTISLRTLGYKDLLESIDHPFVPKTIKVNPDTQKYCQLERENIVLKPADGCEGYGIYFGNKMSGEEWAVLIKDSLSKNYIAQEFIPIPKHSVSLYENNSISEKELYFDLCPHFFIKDGQITSSGHTLMRFSENPIVNVTQGGGIGYHQL